MIFPSITEYRDALQFEGALKKYSTLKLMTDSKGQPCFSSGNFSVVFRMRDKITGKEFAVKCFTRDQERRQKSYELISQNLNKLYSPYLVHYEYLPDEVWVNSKTAGDGEFPAVVMEWVESKTLGEKLSEFCKRKDKSGIFDLACSFDRMGLWLMDQPFAHGDLKTDNILIETNGAMRLIDYDGMFSPEMTGENARENGSPGFRHPKRSANHFGAHIDDFSILLISLSIHALAEDPTVSNQYSFGDAILLDETALNSPGEGKTWELLDKLRSNNEVSQRLVMLYMATGNSAEMRLLGLPMIIKNSALKAQVIFPNDIFWHQGHSRKFEKIELLLIININDASIYLDVEQQEKEDGSEFYILHFANPQNSTEKFSLPITGDELAEQFEIWLCQVQNDFIVDRCVIEKGTKRILCFSA